MNFQDLKKIETADFYLDVAIKNAKKRADLLRQSYAKKDWDQLRKLKHVEIERIAIIKQILTDNFDKIIKAYPSLDDLPEFYKELIHTTLDYATLKKSLGAVNSAKLVIGDIYRIYNLKLKREQDIKRMPLIKREFFGRVSSVPKRIKNELKYLEMARHTMRNYPAIKTGIPTIAIAGFPNVGKSTLLSKVTSSNPEINAYPFTTKGLNVGYMDHIYGKVQFIDTPGTLNRFEKMNPIEKIAYLAMKYAADKIIFVFDPTFTYSFDEQLKLYNNVKKFDKELILYISKTDIAQKENIEKITSLFNDYFTDPNKIKEIKIDFK